MEPTRPSRQEFYSLPEISKPEPRFVSTSQREGAEEKKSSRISSVFPSRIPILRSAFHPISTANRSYSVKPPHRIPPLQFPAAFPSSSPSHGLLSSPSAQSPSRHKTLAPLNSPATTVSPSSTPFSTSSHSPDSILSPPSWTKQRLPSIPQDASVLPTRPARLPPLPSASPAFSDQSSSRVSQSEESIFAESISPVPSSRTSLNVSEEEEFSPDSLDSSSSGSSPDELDEENLDVASPEPTLQLINTRWDDEIRNAPSYTELGDDSWAAILQQYRSL